MLENAEQNDHAQAVQNAEDDPPQLGARRGGGVVEQQVHAQKSGDRHRAAAQRRRAEEMAAGQGVVRQYEQPGGGHRRQRHGGDAEQQLRGHARQENQQVDVRREDLRHRNLRPPGDAGSACQDQPQREQAERERRRVEDVRPAALLVPADELLDGKADRHHQELQVEPVRLEPHEEVDAEDDRERAESEHVPLTARPGEQHVERIGEGELGGDQVRGVVHLAPVPAPVGVDGELRARLHPVLLAEDDVKGESAPPPAGQHMEHDGPGQEQAAGARDRRKQARLPGN
ncbi:MAG: hypothetical protein F4Y57_15305 [Acidobacteria bacterium]|nr:hypothetical protein [Acidobacteriota bacterium]